jgi:hypothetical protein
MKKTSNTRSYPCKSEELTAIAGFVAASLKRDSKKFQEYSHIFSEDFIKNLDEDRNTAKAQLKNAVIDAARLKRETESLYKAMDDLITELKNLSGYIKLAGDRVNAKNFGLSELRAALRKRDAEGSIANMRILHNEMNVQDAALREAGLKDKTVENIQSLEEKIEKCNESQYREKVQKGNNAALNVDLFNSLYVKIMAVCDAGKILFVGKESKLKEYTFVELKKKVRKPVAKK